MPKAKIDSAPLTAVGQHYVARPLFFGMEDPMPKRSGVLKGEADTVTMPDIPLRKPRPAPGGGEKKRPKGSALTTEVWEKITNWATENAPSKGGRHRYWGAMAGFLYRQGVGAEEVSEIIYEATSAANDDEVESRANCALRACDANDRGNNMTGSPTLIEEFCVEGIDEIKKILGTNKASLKDTIENITPATSAEDLNTILVKLKTMPVLAQDQFLKRIKEKTGLGLTKLREALEKARAEGEEASEIQDLGIIAAQQTLQKHYCGGELLIRSSKRNFSYNGRNWEDEPDDYIAGQLIPIVQEIQKQSMSDKSVDSLVREASHLIRYISTRKGDAMRTLEEPYPVINTRNAEIWLNKDGSLDVLPHNADSFQMGCLDVDYDPDATCEQFDKIVLEIFAENPKPEEMRRHLYELMGYVIQPYHDIAAFMLWHGKSNTGKSKLAETLARLIGDDGVITMKLESLAKDKDALGNLLGKRMIIEDDLQQGVDFPDGIIKMISELKRVTGELKYANKFSFINYATPLLIGNHWPKIYAADFSIERRAQVIPFRRSFARNEDDRNLFPSIWKDRKQMSGILNRAIEGCQRLRERKEFDQPEDCKAAYQEWVSGSAFVPVFLNEICIANANGPNQPWKEHCDRFYEWGKIRGIKPNIEPKGLRRVYEGLGIRFGETDGALTVKGIMAPETPM